MYEALLAFFLLVSISLISLILLQEGKGANMGASFGTGVSATLFGSAGSGNFIVRSTAVLSALFFIISLILVNLNNNKISKGGKWDNLTQPDYSHQSIPIEPTIPGREIPQ